MATKTTSLKTKPHKAAGTQIREQKSSKKNPGIYLFLLAAVIITIALLRIRLAGIPLERDEGEYAYMGRLILEGIPPYSGGYNMKLPGTYFMYSIILAIFGKSAAGIHLGLLVMNVATILLLFTGLRRLFNDPIAFLAASLFGFLSLSPAVLGFAAHATHFISFFIAAGIFFISKISGSPKARNVFLFGLMMGLAFLMKQQAIYFILFGGFYTLFNFFDRDKKWLAILKPLGIYSAGVFLPYVITASILFLAGSFDKFWFWTVEYAQKYATGLSFQEGKQAFTSAFGPIFNEYPAIWVFAGLGIILLFLSKFSRGQKFLAITILIFSFLSITPGFYFRQHYFITLLPAVTLLSAISVYYISIYLAEKTKIKVVPVLSILVLSLSVMSAFSRNKEYYFKMEPAEISRTIYQGNPFADSEEVANYIQQNSLPNDRIAVIGSEPQILFYSNRRSATGYLYTYGLMENQPYNITMQNEMISEIEKEKPKYIVFCRIALSWLAKPESPKRIFEWFESYSQNYNLIGLVDVPPGQPSLSVWGNDVFKYLPKTDNTLMVLERKK